MRIGQSTDIHRLVKDRKLVLGGVEIPSELGALGHSDGDALTHAIAESILGALGMGDLGHYFPDNDPQYEGICSLRILESVVQEMDKRGYHINNVDSLILIEKPKMAPYIEEMRKNLAKCMHCSIEQVNVKATRGEKLGFVGDSEGVVGQAVVLLEENDVSKIR